MPDTTQLSINAQLHEKTSLRNIKLNATATKKVDKNLPASKGTPQFSKASPVPHLLTCNTPPNDEEISLIRTAVLDTKHKLSALDQEIPDGHSDSRIYRRKVKLQADYTEFIWTHESMLSRLRGLPVDILEEIFMQTSYLDGIYSTPPWSLSQVCAEWRAIVLDTPLLWNCIEIHLTEEHKTHAKFLQSLSIRLNRSRQIPLNLFITSKFGSEYTQHPVIELLVETRRALGRIYTSRYPVGLYTVHSKQ